MADITSVQLAKLTGYSPRTIRHEQKEGRLSGVKRQGVRGRVHDKKSVIAWLRYKCLSHLIDKLP